MRPPRVLLFTITLIVALAGGLITLEYDRLTKGFYAQMSLSEARGVRDRLSILLSAPLSAQGLSARLLSGSGPGSLDQAEAERVLLSALESETIVAAATLMDTRGVIAMAARSPDGRIALVRPRGEPAGGKTGSLGQVPDVGTPPVDRKALEDYGRMLADAARSRTGGWPAWTESRLSPERHGTSLSAVIPTGPGGDESLLLAFSFSLDVIRDALAQDLPQDARALVALPGRRPPGTAGQEQSTIGQPRLLVPAGDASNPVVDAAFEAWVGEGRPTAEAFRFQTSGTAWWASLTPLTEDEGGICVGLAVPQENLLAMLFAGRKAPVLIGGGLLLALALLVVLMVQSRRRGKDAVSFFPTEEALRGLINQGESDRLEFKSTLRFNLAAGKPGKEIELASLKTLTAFLNTDGGVLVVGVDDQGRIVGLDRDGFENDDHVLRHFTAIFTQHVGVEFLHNVTFALRPLDGRKVLVVECRRSREPVILKGGKEEEFYVRAGPSSRKLTLTEFMRRVTGKPVGG